MKRFVLSIAILVLCIHSNAQQQQGRPLKLTIVNDAGQALPAASVYLLTTDSVEIQVQGSDQKGIAEFEGLQGNDYLLKVSHTGYQTVFLNISNLQQQSGYAEKITLQQQASSLQGVTVTSNRPFVQFDPDKTVINVDAGITNAGATVMDVLQKSPGITVSREGAIIMKGKPSVMVWVRWQTTAAKGRAWERQRQCDGMHQRTTRDVDGGAGICPVVD